jgi:Tol biopolymer transport system component
MAGVGQPRELGRIQGTLHDLTPDRKVLLYTSYDNSLYSMQRDGGQPQKVVQTSGNELIHRGAFSPDARWVLYMLVAPNTYEVYAQPFPAGGLRQQIAASPAEFPVWRRDGKEILYVAGTEIRAVDLQEVGNRLRVGMPKTLFAIRRPPNLTLASVPLQVTRDGSRIVFIQPIEQPPGTQAIHIAAAWDSSLR